jgi:hypothetical protein
MNEKKLKEAAESFLKRYPGGFDNPVMVEISKKHKPEKMYALAKNTFDRNNFKNIEKFSEDLIRFISRASVVSVFEKTRFRDFMKNCSYQEKEQLADSLRELIHGDQEKAFLLFYDLLAPYKLAKWTLITSCAAYYSPHTEAFIKPTTVKKAIALFELENLKYTPMINYEFYDQYREALQKMKEIVNITQDCLAFGGIIMLTTE